MMTTDFNNSIYTSNIDNIDYSNRARNPVSYRAERTVRTMGGENKYLHSLLCPQDSIKASIPDDDMTPHVIKVIKGIANLTGSTDYVFYVQPFSSRNLVRLGVRVLNPTGPGNLIGWTQALTLDEDLADNYERARSISNMFELYSDTVPSGAFAINGRITAANFHSQVPVVTLDPQNVTQFNTSHSVANVGILDGIVGLGLPESQQEYLSFEPSSLDSGPSLAYTLTSPAINLTLWDVDMNTVGFPNWLDGTIEFDLDLGFDAPVGSNTMTITFWYLADTGLFVADTIFTPSAIGASAGHASYRFHYSASFNTEFPISRITVETSGLPTGFGGASQSLVVRCPTALNHHHNPSTLVYVSGTDAATNVVFNQHYNYEAVPSSDLSRDMQASSYVADDPSDFHLAKLAVSRSTGVQPLYSRREYLAMHSRVAENVGRAYLNSVRTAGLWDRFLKGGRSALQFARRTKNYWGPALTAVNPYLGGVASAIITAGKDQSQLTRGGVAKEVYCPAIVTHGDESEENKAHQTSVSPKNYYSGPRAFEAPGLSENNSIIHTSGIEDMSVEEIMAHLASRGSFPTRVVPRSDSLSVASVVNEVSQASITKAIKEYRNGLHPSGLMFQYAAGVDDTDEPFKVLYTLTSKPVSQLDYVEVGALKYSDNITAEAAAAVETLVEYFGDRINLENLYLSYVPVASGRLSSADIVAGSSSGMALFALMSGLPRGLLWSGSVQPDGNQGLNFEQVTKLDVKKTLGFIVHSGGEESTRSTDVLNAVMARDRNSSAIVARTAGDVMMSPMVLMWRLYDQTQALAKQRYRESQAIIREAEEKGETYSRPKTVQPTITMDTPFPLGNTDVHPLIEQRSFETLGDFYRFVENELDPRSDTQTTPGQISAVLRALNPSSKDGKERLPPSIKRYRTLLQYANKRVRERASAGSARPKFADIVTPDFLG